MERAMQTELEEQVCAWLRRELRVPARIAVTPLTRINLDLGVAGADGDELVDAFKKAFHAGDLPRPLVEYFGEEGCATPLTLLLAMLRRARGQPTCSLPPLYVADLIALVPMVESW